ncbi:MAG: hypothetical protein LLG14_22630 [Nocardiaceae bacterium]|nr:hypothetical protein [Nocardiaceae bacterium]
MITHNHLPVRQSPIGLQSQPAVWLLGARGGVGVTTLASFWDGWAADSRREWPCGNARSIESPYVVIVARETIAGLQAAHELVMHHGAAQLECEILGLITVAASRELPKPVRQYREIVTAAVESAGGSVWTIGWHKQLPATDSRKLRSWHPHDGLPASHRRPAPEEPPADVIAAGARIVGAIQQALPRVYRCAS